MISIPCPLIYTRGASLEPKRTVDLPLTYSIRCYFVWITVWSMEKIKKLYICKSNLIDTDWRRAWRIVQYNFELETIADKSLMWPDTIVNITVNMRVINSKYCCGEPRRLVEKIMYTMHTCSITNYCRRIPNIVV